MPSDIRDRDYMYQLMIGWAFEPTSFYFIFYSSQLLHDGHQEVAFGLASCIGRTESPPAPSNQLFGVIERALQVNKAQQWTEEGDEGSGFFL